MASDLRQELIDSLKELKSLREENSELKEKVASLEKEHRIYKKAHDLSFNLWNNGVIPAESIENRFNDLAEKEEEDLQTLEKAAELMQSPDFNLGELSGEQSDSDTDPLTSFLLGNEY